MQHRTSLESGKGFDTGRHSIVLILTIFKDFGRYLIAKMINKRRVHLLITS
jgi:hypothetical protein